MKCLPSGKVTLQAGSSPIEFLSSYKSNLSDEIFYNMGITLYFLNKYEEAFEVLTNATQTYKLNGNVNI